MKFRIANFAVPVLLAVAATSGWADTGSKASYTSTSAKLASITPEQALQRLMDGNKRFVGNASINRNLLQQAKSTSKKGQFPTALILSCMDSRGAPEVVLDQGLGDVFTVRLAGNVIDADQLGGMEYATKLVGTKLLVVMGHTQCGAVGGACAGAELGNLTQLLDKIQPAVEAVKSSHDGKINCDDGETVDLIAKQNVLDMIKQIPEQSEVISQLVKDKKVMIVGAMHHLKSGKVTFFNAAGTELK